MEPHDGLHTVNRDNNILLRSPTASLALYTTTPVRTFTAGKSRHMPAQAKGKGVHTDLSKASASAAPPSPVAEPRSSDMHSGAGLLTCGSGSDIKKRVGAGKAIISADHGTVDVAHGGGNRARVCVRAGRVTSIGRESELAFATVARRGNRRLDSIACTCHVPRASKISIPAEQYAPHNSRECEPPRRGFGAYHARFERGRRGSMRQANVRQHVKQVLWGRWGRGARGVGGRGNRPQPTRTECQSQSIESAKGHSSTLRGRLISYVICLNL